MVAAGGAAADRRHQHGRLQCRANYHFNKAISHSYLLDTCPRGDIILESPVEVVWGEGLIKRCEGTEARMRAGHRRRTSQFTMRCVHQVI